MWGAVQGNEADGALLYAIVLLSTMKQVVSRSRQNEMEFCLMLNTSAHLPSGAKPPDVWVLVLVVSRHVLQLWDRRGWDHAHRQE